MNFRPIAFAAALVLAGAGRAAESPVPNYTPLRIIQTEPASFPRNISNLGLTSGEAWVSIQLDETGKLTDYVVTSYTHPRFAESAVDALKRWRYEPAVLKGEKRGVTADLKFTFETRGLVVVDLTPMSFVELRNLELRPTAYSYRARRLSELDRTPTPVKVVKPAYPVDPAKQREVTTITVYFFIDTEGRVRLPAVDRAAGEEFDVFAASAVDAVSQWQFEPPLYKGNPVLVSARQEFRFNPTARR